jgi:hypothetical protein
MYPYVALRCPTYRENSHANHTWHQGLHETACFLVPAAPSPWVRFPSPAPLFVGSHWPTYTAVASAACTVFRLRRYGAAKPHSRNLRKTPLPDSMYRNCNAQELFVSSAKSRTIPPLRVSEKLRADAESVLAPGETLSAFVMDAVSRTIDFRKSQLDFLARGIASSERARAKGDYVPADKVIAELRKRLANAQRVRK